MVQKVGLGSPPRSGALATSRLEAAGVRARVPQLPALPAHAGTRERAGAAEGGGYPSCFAEWKNK